VLREDDVKFLRAHEHTRRPLRDEEFLATLAENLGGVLKRQKPGQGRDELENTRAPDSGQSLGIRCGVPGIRAKEAE
jgi:hypothetical protein